MRQFRRTLRDEQDIHARLMSVYPQVPEWWYLGIFLTMFTAGIVSVEAWPTQFPVWAFVLALIIAFVYIIPIGMIQAITNQQIGLNVITELIIGYALPGRPVAMMLFKTYVSRNHQSRPRRPFTQHLTLLCRVTSRWLRLSISSRT